VGDAAPHVEIDTNKRYRLSTAHTARHGHCTNNITVIEASLSVLSTVFDIIWNKIPEVQVREMHELLQYWKQVQRKLRHHGQSVLLRIRETITLEGIFAGTRSDL
jgi:hypothetical protein